MGIIAKFSASIWRSSGFVSYGDSLPYSPLPLTFLRQMLDFYCLFLCTRHGVHFLVGNVSLSLLVLGLIRALILRRSGKNILDL